MTQICQVDVRDGKADKESFTEASGSRTLHFSSQVSFSPSLVHNLHHPRILHPIILVIIIPLPYTTCLLLQQFHMKKTCDYLG